MELINNIPQMAAPLLAGLLILWVPGLLLGIATGLPRALRWGWAPAGSVAIIAVTAMIAPIISMPWGIPTAAAGTVCTVAAAAVVRIAIAAAHRRHALRRLHISTPPQHATCSVRADATDPAFTLPQRSAHPSTSSAHVSAYAGSHISWGSRIRAALTPIYSAPRQAGPLPRHWYRCALTCALAGASIAGFVKFFRATGSFTNFIQNWDMSYHVNSVQAIVQTKNGSSLNAVLADPTAPGLYPCGFHDVASLIVLATGADVPSIAQLTALIFAFIVLPIGVATLAYVAFQRQLITLVAGLVALAFPAFPLAVLWWGPLYSNLAGWALVPASLALFVWVFSVTPRSKKITPLFCVLISLAGITLSQPNAAATWLIAAWTYGTWSAVTAAVHSRSPHTAAPHRTSPRHTTWPKAAHSPVVHATLVGIGCCALGVLIWLSIAFAIGFDRLASMNQRTPEGPLLEALAHGVGMLGAHPHSPLLRTEIIRVAPLSVLVVIGIVIVALREKGRWSVAVYGMWLALFLAVYSSPSHFIRNYIGSLWYNDVPRLLAPLVMLAPIFVGVAIDTLITSAWRPQRQPQLSHRAIRSGARALAIMALAGVIVWALQLPTWGAAWGPLRRFSTQTDKNLVFFVDQDEYTLFKQMRTIVPEQALVIGNPWEGATFAWAISGRRAVIPTPEFYEGARLYPYLSDHLSEGATNPQVCRELKRHGISYALDLADSSVPEARLYPGLRHTANGNLGPVVAQVGEAKLVHITKCG
ncbi:MAG: DUF6541 family protein [Arcanobacterium sp.]|nr:DUF6541 family protein [Arcanobacterium sp.]